MADQKQPEKPAQTPAERGGQRPAPSDKPDQGKGSEGTGSGSGGRGSNA